MTFARSCVSLAFGLGALTAPQAVEAALAAGAPIGTMQDMPPPVAALYRSLCPPESWISGQVSVDGSSQATFSDGTRVFLLVCGDAASVVPYVVIVVPPSGTPQEATFHWRLNGRRISDAGISNAQIGIAPDTIESSSHASATCEPSYVHRWTGASFELVRVDRRGCRRDE